MINIGSSIWPPGEYLRLLLCLSHLSRASIPLRAKCVSHLWHPIHLWQPLPTPPQARSPALQALWTYFLPDTGLPKLKSPLLADSARPLLDNCTRPLWLPMFSETLLMQAIDSEVAIWILQETPLVLWKVFGRHFLACYFTGQQCVHRQGRCCLKIYMFCH